MDIDIWEFGLQYQHRSTLKAQQFMDFIKECLLNKPSMEDQFFMPSLLDRSWNLFIDMVYIIKGYEVCIMLISPN